jgi:YidC/Oxa1 family membrane protein insertase
MAKQMQQMTKVMPLMYLVFGFTLPAGLNVYFLVSSLFRIGQQTLIYKLDPTLLPGHGAKTLESRDVTKERAPATESKAKSKPAGATGGNGTANPPTPAPATAGPTPARVANRPANKKKKRR